MVLAVDLQQKVPATRLDQHLACTYSLFSRSIVHSSPVSEFFLPMPQAIASLLVHFLSDQPVLTTVTEGADLSVLGYAGSRIAQHTEYALNTLFLEQRRK